MEEKVEATTLLEEWFKISSQINVDGMNPCFEVRVGFEYGRTFAARAIQREVSRPLLPMRVVIMPNLQADMKFSRSSTFSLSSGSFLLAALYLPNLLASI